MVNNHRFLYSDFQKIKKKAKQRYRAILRYSLNKQNRQRLKIDEFSIISANCVGGGITHELGKKFLSPTVNLFFEAEDFLKFLENIKFYTYDADLIPDEDKTIECGYPVGILSDIKLYFVHYATFEEAKKKWEERSKRILWDKLYIIMVQRDGCTEEHIKRFDSLPYERKVIFVSKKMDQIKSACYIEGTETEKGEVTDLLLYENRLTGRRLIDRFDYVEFLNKI